MGFGVRLFLCVLFAFAILCSARNTIPLSGNEMVQLIEGRSLKVSTDDYQEPGPSHRHDPPSRKGGSSIGPKSP